MITNVYKFQISYNYLLSFEDIPKDLIPLTAHFKEILSCATAQQVTITIERIPV